MCLICYRAVAATAGRLRFRKALSCVVLINSVLIHSILSNSVLINSALINGVLVKTSEPSQQTNHKVQHKHIYKQCQIGGSLLVNNTKKITHPKDKFYI